MSICIIKSILRAGKLVGAVLYGDVADGPRFFNMMKQDQSLDDYTLVSMLHKGTETESNNVAALSDDSTICGCNGVSKGK